MQLTPSIHMHIYPQIYIIIDALIFALKVERLKEKEG